MRPRSNMKGNNTVQRYKSTERAKTIASRRSIAALSCVLAAGAMLVNSASPATAAAKPTGLVGYMSWNTGADPFATALASATLAEAKKLGVNLDYVNANGDQSKQISAIQTFIDRGAKAIIVFPENETSIVPILNEAAAKGIKVIDMNEALAKNAKIFTYVGDNDYTYGELEARLLVKALNGKGTFALAEGLIGSAAEINRTAGIKHVLKSYPNIHMISVGSDGFTTPKALSLAQDWLTKYSSKLNAIVYEGPEGYVGGEWAAAHGHKGVKIILGDYPTYVRPAIEKGYVYGTVDQSPPLEAQDSMKVAYDILTGQEAKVPRPAWYIPLPLVTSANVKSIAPAW